MATLWTVACTDPAVLGTDAAAVDATAPLDAAALAEDAAAADATVPPGQRVFVTSGDYAATDLAAFDSLCDDIATATSLGGRWTAWLAVGRRGGGERVEGDGPWVDLAGAVVFPDRAAFASGPVARLRLDERGQEVRASPVWTGTSGDGTATGNNCQNWSTNAAADVGTLGSVGEGTSEWTRRATAAPCSGRGHVYCFERPAP
jgi:hypothetical protein